MRNSVKNKLLVILLIVVSLFSCHEEETNSTTQLPIPSQNTDPVVVNNETNKPTPPENAPKKKILVKDKSKWKIVKASSSNKTDPPIKAIDGNGATFWHSQFTPKSLPHPHELQIQMDQETLIYGFSYLTRQGGPLNGTIKEYEFFATNDLNNWGEPLSKGTFVDIEYGRDLQLVYFNSPVQAKYIMLRSISEVSGNPFACIAEINVIIEE